MTEHMTADARALAEQAYEHAIRLGHPYLGAEHFLLALAAADQPADGRNRAGTGHLAGAGHVAGAVLREHGVTPGRVEAEIVRLAGGRPVR